MEENDAVLCGHYAKMLGLTGDWKVSGVDLSVSEKRLELEVKWEQSGAVCPECGQECSRYDVAEERRWRHLDAMGFETVDTSAGAAGELRGAWSLADESAVGGRALAFHAGL